MYSWEIQKLLEDRNYYIGGDDLVKVTSSKENPQLNHIKFNPDSNEFEMWDEEGNYFKFKAMPYKEAVQRGLVKSKQVIQEDDYER